METPTISVVMPAFNVAKYIGEAIESIQAQTYTNWELVIADDCSSDDTRNIVRKYQKNDDRIRLIERNKNSGGCRIPRFDAIMASKGKWICTVDADDTIEADMFTKLLERQSDTNADMVLNRIIICNENLEKSSRMLPAADFDMSQIISGREALGYTVNGWLISVTCSLISANVYKQYLGGTDWQSYNGPFSDELDHRKILLTADRISFVDAEYYYRQQPNSVVHDCSAKSFNGIHYIINLLDFIYSISQDDSNLIKNVQKEYLNRIYRYQVRFECYGRRFTESEQAEIRRLIINAYRRFRKDNMKFEKFKDKLLVSHFMIFKLISILATKYINLKSR